MGRDWNMALGRGVEVGDRVLGMVAVGDVGGTRGCLAARGVGWRRESSGGCVK